MNDLREKVAKAVAALIVRQPFIGIMAKNTWILYDPSSALPAYTDGLKVYLGPAAAGMDAKALSEVIAHEVVHIALKHPLRGRSVAARTGLPQPLLNLIADAIVNGYLEAAELLNALKSAAVTPRLIEDIFGVAVEGRSFEEIAEEIAKRLRGAQPTIKAKPTLGEDIYATPPSSEEGSCRCDKGSGAKERKQGSDGEMGGEAQRQTGKETSGSQKGVAEKEMKSETGETGRGKGGEGARRLLVLNEGEEGEAGELSDEEKERAVEKKVLSATTAVKTAGNAPAWLDRFIREVLHAKVDWRRVLREKLRLFFGSDYRPTWMRLNKKVPGVYPGKVYYERGDVVVLADTSGSISEKELQQFVSEVFAIARDVKRKVVVIPWDAVAYDPIEVGGYEDVKKVKLRGGGGTLIAPALRAAEKYIRPTTRVVILSDWYIGDLGTSFVQEWLRKRASQVLAVTTSAQPPSFLQSVKIQL